MDERLTVPTFWPEQIYGVVAHLGPGIAAPKKSVDAWLPLLICRAFLYLDTHDLSGIKLITFKPGVFRSTASMRRGSVLSRDMRDLCHLTAVRPAQMKSLSGGECEVSSVGISLASDAGNKSFRWRKTERRVVNRR
jgi:hypothetical protein